MMHKAMFGQEVVRPTPGGSGACLVCGREVIAKCGERNTWHWAHKTGKACDPWWEPETQWHSDWKSCFPDEYQEIVHFDSATGEKHIADVKTETAMVIEFQHSPIGSDELKSRERFYKKMMWIVDGLPFRENVDVLHALPDPTGQLASEYQFSIARTFSRKSDLKNCRKGDLVQVFSTDDIAAEINREYKGHHAFKWKNPRSVWFEATSPVFLDFGEEHLWWLMRYYADGSLWCVRKVSKKQLIEKNGGKASAR